MALLTPALVTYLLLFLASLFTLFYIYVLNGYRYWEKKGVPYVKPKFPWGAMKGVLFQTKSYTETISEAYKQMNKFKYIGFFSFSSPGIIINDLDIIKHIMVKDFNYFTDRGVFSNKKIDPLSAHLVTTDGQEWKFLRGKMSPSFSASKLRNMFDVVVKCGEQLQTFVAKESATSEALEWKEVFARYGYEVISKTAFGLETNTFDKSSSKYFDVIRTILEPSMIQWFRIALSFYNCRLAKFLNIRVFPKHVTDFYMSIVRDTVHYRENRKVNRNDLLQQLMELRGEEITDKSLQEKSKEPYMSVTMSDIAAHALIFFWSGYEAPSSVLSFCVYELAMNTDMQSRLREEVDGLEGELTYENVHALQYLDMIINETLRKYPPLGLSKRICTQDYKVPDSDLVIEKGTIVVIPTRSLHMNPEFYPEPEKFIPERFSKENVKNIKPFSYLPFGEGPRMCIGMRFAIMQMKIAIVQLLQKFEFKLAMKTPTPMVFDPTSIVLNAAGGMWLKAVERCH